MTVYSLQNGHDEVIDLCPLGYRRLHWDMSRLLTMITL
jgi:hypothetical protein